MAGVGTGVLFAGAFFLPQMRYTAPLLTAFWIMLVAGRLRAGRREEIFLAGGVWLMALSAAGAVWRLGAYLTEGVSALGTEMGSAGSLREGVFLPEKIQGAAAAAFLLMAALYLLDRGKLYPLWMAILVMFGMLSDFLGSIHYAEPWQNHVMTMGLYLTAGGLLLCQQVSCTRQELESAFWERGKGNQPGGSEILRNPGEAAEQRGRKRPGVSVPALGGSDWREAADREFRHLQIFEHDFRHHLDMLAALYEDGHPAEARAYMEDLKQFRASRQGRRIGGERELSYIMMAKREACRQAEISFSYQIVGSPRGITQMDMTALLLNLLDNAIRACREVPKPRSISVMLLSRGELWEIEMTNSGKYEPGQTVEEGRRKEAGGVGRGGKRQDAEGAVHGIGMVSVGQIVEKYQGRSRIWQEDGVVRQKLILVQRLPREASE